MSSCGAARIIGPSSAATRCSPMKNDDSPYMRWKRSSGVDPLVPVDPVLREVDVLRRPLLALPQRVELPVVEQLRLAPVGGGHQRGVGGRLVVGALGAGGGVAHARSLQATGWLANLAGVSRRERRRLAESGSRWTGLEPTSRRSTAVRLVGRTRCSPRRLGPTRRDAAVDVRSRPAASSSSRPAWRAPSSACPGSGSSPAAAPRGRASRVTPLATWMPCVGFAPRTSTICARPDTLRTTSRMPRNASTCAAPASSPACPR